MDAPYKNRCSRQPSPSIRLAPLMLAASTGLAHAAVDIAQQPLVIAKPVPPNILFIMDDSGSMAWQHMPGTEPNWASAPPSGLPYRGALVNDVRLRAANVNSQWYNPATTYHPWMNHDGTSWGNIDPRKAPWDPSGALFFAGNAHDLGKTTWPVVDVLSLDTSTTRSDWRFQGFYVLTPGADPARTENYKRIDFRRNGDAWEARVNALDANGASTGYTTPTSFSWPGSTTRTIAEEVQNYANWFSYYRIRASMAKASASRIFAGLGQEFRVGYNTIWDRNNFPIPVGSDSGLFRGANKKTWFENLFATTADNGTPLRKALDNAGKYFGLTDASGPWGPEVGPNQISCRQNFAILTTDGYWNSAAADTVGAREDADSTNGSTITSPAGVSYAYDATKPYKDGRSDTLADVAMYYWKNDLRTDLKNDVPTTPSNPAFWQHMVTFGISIGEKGVLDPASDLPHLISGAKSWPEPGNDRQANIDDLWHAALNSRGSFVVASDPRAFEKGLKDALDSIKERQGSGAALAANSTKLETGTTSFQAQYYGGTWRGELSAFSVDPATGMIAATPKWQATSKIPAWSARTIMVHDPQGTAAGKYKRFEWDNLSSAQKAALHSESVVNYLRGDQSGEEAQPGGRFRNRTALLGDIVNAQPVFVGAPNARLYTGASFAGASDYASFAVSKAGRTPMIYVGANDGMLHAFRVNDGTETYAFVPNAAILNGLNRLSDPDYLHRYFVDGEMTVADAFIEGKWRTILVATLGRGGRGVFALDVTDPEKIGFLWELGAADVPALGNNLGKPVIAQVADGDWRVLIGNGPNSTGEAAQLIMIKLSDGSHVAVDTGAAGSNGLSGIRAWDSTGDGFMDAAYAGDLKGNIWRFSGLPASPVAGKLFHAQDGGNVAQPITATPLAVRDPDTGRLWLFVGTGQYLNEADVSSKQVQTWYGLVDSGSTIPGRSSLVSREILAEGEIHGFAARVINEGSPADLVGKSGWYMELKSPTQGAEGERMIAPNQLQGRVLIGTTRIPIAEDVCNPGGKGFVMALNPFTGARLDRTFFDINLDGNFNEADKLKIKEESAIVSGIGLPSSPHDPLFTENYMQVNTDDGDSPKTIKTQGSGATAGRLSWRELVQ